MSSTVSETMRSSLYYGSGDVRPTDQPVPEIGPGEVLVSVHACGICGSDTMAWYRDPKAKAAGGINTGHEITGEIVKVGDKVRIQLHGRPTLQHG